ncbi:uncharacterized protein EDB93DRAFT_944354 [Suillus bovinus]|uniref:uncharacterized protein n=1 Tax=Suillus bovinus TaxID=48563 RepID=UPI001B87D5EC|nr:uncharacterized protein EDB93DRAFT_944354 [Suillus bovinus]KAG2131257.1 hypothetical protein EDB93DRAFT_944354 [Suillus bovinus]
MRRSSKAWAMGSVTIHARVSIGERRRRRRRAMRKWNNMQRVAQDLITWPTGCAAAFHKSLATRFKTATCPIMNLALHSLNCVGGVAMILIRLSVQVPERSRLKSDSVWPVQLHHQDLAPPLWRKDDGEMVMAVLAECQMRTMDYHRKRDITSLSRGGRSMARLVLTIIKCPSKFDALPVPRSPEHGVPATQSDEPLTTQQTLVNSPTDIRSRQVPSARVTTVVQTASTSSQAISIAQPLRAARRPPSHRGRVQREQKPAAGTEIHSRIKRTSSKSRSNQPAVTASDAPYRHTRARSQSIDLPSQPAPASKRQRVVSAKGKGKMKEPELEEVLEDDSERNASQGPHTPNRCLEADTFQEQQDVEDHLLKGGSSLIDSEQSDSEASHEQQEFTVDSSSEDPSDSDDAATHENLERSGQRLTRMAAAGFRSRLPNTSVLLASNKARVTTRSSAIRITRHAAQAPPFPSPGTTKTIKRRGN